MTRELAQFASRGQALAHPEEALRRVRTGLIDTVAVMLAGRDEPVVGILRRFVQARGGASDQSSFLLGSARGFAADAALVNGTAAHALDYDDVGLQGHPSAVLVPALLAEGERLHASGLSLLRAYIVGFESWAELISRDEDLHHAKGWHPTAVFGAVGAAAAVACLRGLDVVQCGHALGLAATTAGGVVANFGSMAKPFHAGHAAAAAIDAVNLAAAGMTAAPDALEHRSGFLAAISPRGRVDLESPATDLGLRLRLLASGLTVKKYPMCFATHRVIDATLDLVRLHDVRLEQVEALHVSIGRAQANMLRNHEPRTALEAKFSLEFAMAAAVVERQVGLAQLRQEVIERPEVRALFPKVRITLTDTVCASEPTLAASDRVVIELAGGTKFDSGEVVEARGGAGTPMAESELRAKFMDCVAGLDDVDAQGLYGALQDIHGIADVASLAAAAPR